MVDLKPQKFEKKSFPPLDAGSRPAYIVGLAAIGTQLQRPYRNDPKSPAQEILFQFEIAGETIETDDGDELPRIISNRILFSGGDNSNLTKTMRALDPTGEKTDGHSNVTGLIGVLCNVELTKTEKKDKSGFVNYVKGVSPFPRLNGYTPPECLSEPVTFSFYNPVFEDYEKFPVWIKKVMKESAEMSPDTAVEAYTADYFEKRKVTYETVIEELTEGGKAFREMLQANEVQTEQQPQEATAELPVPV